MVTRLIALLNWLYHVNNRWTKFWKVSNMRVTQRFENCCSSTRVFSTTMGPEIKLLVQWCRFSDAQNIWENAFINRYQPLLQKFPLKIRYPVKNLLLIRNKTIFCLFKLCSVICFNYWLKAPVCSSQASNVLNFTA